MYSLFLLGKKKNDSIHRYTVQYTDFCPIRCSLQWDCPSLSTRKYRNINIVQNFVLCTFILNVQYTHTHTSIHICCTNNIITICIYKASKAPLSTSRSCSAFLCKCEVIIQSGGWPLDWGEAVWSTHPSPDLDVLLHNILHFACLGFSSWINEPCSAAVRPQCAAMTLRVLPQPYEIQLHHKLHPTFQLTNLTKLQHHRKNRLISIESNLYIKYTRILFEVCKEGARNNVFKYSLLIRFKKFFEARFKIRVDCQCLKFM